MSGGEPEQLIECRSLRSWRLDAGWSAAELADRSGVSRPVVLRLEAGERHGEGWALVKLANALGVTPDAIASGVDHPTTSIAELRAGRGIDRRKLAELTGVPRSTIARAENGSAIHPHFAKRLADFFGVRVSAWYPAPDGEPER